MLLDGQREKIVEIVGQILLQIEAQRSKIEIDHKDLGTEIDLTAGHQPDLDALLKSYYQHPTSEALKQGIKDLGAIIGPHVTSDELGDIADAAAKLVKEEAAAHGVLNARWDGVECCDGVIWRA